MCTQCDYKTSYKTGLRAHQLRTHTKERPFACNQCDKTFKRNHHLKQHMRLHTGVFTSSNLERHRKAVHEGNMCTYMCTQCDYKTSYKHNLRYHLSIHLKSCSKETEILFRAHLKTNTPSANAQQRLIEPHPVSEDNHMCTPELNGCSGIYRLYKRYWLYVKKYNQL